MNTLGIGIAGCFICSLTRGSWTIDALMSVSTGFADAAVAACRNLMRLGFINCE
jgi:hypothetical protein